MLLYLQSKRRQQKGKKKQRENLLWGQHLQTILNRDWLEKYSVLFRRVLSLENITVILPRESVSYEDQTNDTSTTTQSVNGGAL